MVNDITAAGSNYQTRVRALGLSSRTLGAALNVKPSTMRVYLSGLANMDYRIERRLQKLLTRLEDHDERPGRKHGR